MIGSAAVRPGWVWRAGAAHVLVGQLLLFLTLHPLRDALDAHALGLVQVMSAVQTANGLGLMVLAGRAGRLLAPLLVAAGTLISAAMIWIIAFTGAHPFDPAVPIGGLAMVLGWLLVVLGRD